MNSYRIRKVKARQILDSRGNPTVEVDVFTRVWRGRAKVPSGASTGKHEALELRDKGKAFSGKGVMKAVNNVNKIIAPKMKGRDVRKQRLNDRYLIRLDGTKNKSKLGANAILGVSLACARAAAHSEHKVYYKYLKDLCKTRSYVIPVPFLNVINGGEHADNTLVFQEFMLAPLLKNYSESLQAGVETYHALKKIIRKKYGVGASNVGDEGGFAPNIKRVREALDLLIRAIKNAGYTGKIKIGMDTAASYFYKKNGYYVDGKRFTSDKLLEFYENLIADYPIVSIEDPFHEEDFESFANLTESVGKKVMVVGDDLTVTNIDRIKKAAKQKACNCLLLKVNQIGTLTEAIDAALLAKKHKWRVMAGNRSGETEDAFVADFAIGLGCGLLKAGAPARGERTAKYNELLRIEEALGKKAVYGKFL